MVHMKELVNYCDDLLEVYKFSDYAPNGLQVEGKAEINKIVTGVTASQALIDAAVEARADALLVHHGFFWRGEAPNVVGVKRRRLAKLLQNNISLLAYHLPLDAHAEIGNNAQLAKVLGLRVEGRFGREAGDELAMYGQLPMPVSAAEFSQQINKALGRTPLHIKALGRTPLHINGESDVIKKVAWCTGAAQGYIEKAATLGVHAFISGEISESTTHFARESGVHYFAAGHHATERYGIKALGEHLVNEFGLVCDFIDIANPV